MISHGQLKGWEPFFGHALAPLFAAFLMASSAANGSNGGLVARLLQHESLVALGEFSFEAGLKVIDPFFELRGLS